MGTTHPATIDPLEAELGQGLVYTAKFEVMPDIKLADAEKLEIEKAAYGKVIRMMAHEVNNSIGPINSILESLEHMKVK